jgi:hypothetical protein
MLKFRRTKMWVLVIIFAVGTGGYGTGPAVNFQEFNTKSKCERARETVVTQTRLEYPNVKTLRAFCIER